MKCAVLIMFFSFSIPIGISQMKIKPVIGVYGTSEVFCLNILGKEEDDATDLRLLGLDLNPGIKLQTNSSTFSVLFTYQYNAFSDLYYFSQYQNHMVGGEIQLSLLNESKRFRPYFSVAVNSEIATNTKNAYVNDYYVPEPVAYSHDFASDGFYIYYDSRFYQSTPIVASIITGCNFRIKEELHIKLGFGYKFRTMETKYAGWEQDENVYEKLKTIPSEKHYFHMLNAQLGLTYTFSLKNKPKPQ